MVTQAKELLPQSFIEVEKVISTQASKVHPIHAHKHYDFLTKGTRRLLIANSLYIVDASEFALDPFQLDIIVHKSDFVPSPVLNIISYLKENFQEPMISSPKNFPSPKPL